MLWGLLFLLSAGVASAHSPGSNTSGAWIGEKRLINPVGGEWCCNEHDCSPLAVKPDIKGDVAWLHSTSEAIPVRTIVWRSMDGQWWRCRRLDGSTRCLIGPPSGM